MLKTKRLAPQFDCLEGKILLSAGMGDPAKSGHKDVAKPFVLNGSLSGLPNGSPGVNGYTETSFPVSGHLGTMGTVHGSFSLKNPFIAMGKLPNLSGASLTLENAKGTVDLAITHSNKQQYKYTIESGTDDYASKSGSGTLEISSPRSTLDLVVRLQSKTVKK